MEEPGTKRRRVCDSEHDIFLSHNEEERAFAEQLYVDLERANQHPFFSDCRLGKVEKCRVGVVVVSEGYLTSKLQMLELSKLVEGGVPVLPLFWKLSPSDFKETNWKLWWRLLVEEGKVGEEVVELWSKAVKELLSSNGLDFRRFGTSEFNYKLADMVEEVCKRWPPILECSTSDGIQGYSRLREVVCASMFREAKVGGPDWRVEKYLGIYGAGGLGKTTLCKSMCKYFFDEFGGRVLYMNLPSDEAYDQNAGEKRLDWLKHALLELVGVDKSDPDLIYTEEGHASLKARVTNMPPLFLAIDNVDFPAFDEARRCLKIGLPSGSKVLVTAREPEILIAILGEAECCKPIPRLEHWVDAATLLLSYAAPKVSSVSCLKLEEREILEKCLSQCQFSGEYHPLVLRAVGTYFHNVCRDDVMIWGKALESSKEMQGCGEAASVNDMLGMNFHSLSDQVKLVFLDSVLCYNLFTKGNMSGWWFEEPQNDFQKWVSWISEVHGVSASEANTMVKELQRLSLVESSDSKVLIHDLYKEFARALVEKEGSREWKWWMSQSSDQMQTLKRLVLECDSSEIGVAPRRFLEFGSVAVLDLSECNDVGPDLELGSFHSLRTLCVVHCRNVKRILCSCNKDNDDGVCCGQGCMSELLNVRLSWLESLEGIPFTKHCWNLQHFDMYCGSNAVRFADGPIDFRYLQALESFSFCGSYSVGCDSDAFMRSLRCALQLRNLVAFEFVCPEDMKAGYGDTLDLNEVVGLSSRLSFLHLSLPRQIKEVKGLHLLRELTLLNLSGSRGLDSFFPNLRCLSKLKWLCVNGCLSVEPRVGSGVRGICDHPSGYFTGHAHHQVVDMEIYISTYITCTIFKEVAIIWIYKSLGKPGELSVLRDALHLLNRDLLGVKMGAMENRGLWITYERLKPWIEGSYKKLTTLCGTSKLFSVSHYSSLHPYAPDSDFIKANWFNVHLMEAYSRLTASIAWYKEEASAE